MKLQSDPTIVYGLVFGKGTLGHSITKAELEQATPYNTYIISGLPPGPICNPGKAALEAVANPATTKDLFFVADGTGGHAFAETLDQHLKNVAHWRQIEKDAKDKLAPDASPPGSSTHGELDSPDPKVFGAVAPLGAPPSAKGALSPRLAKLGEQRKIRDALLGANGELSASKVSGKSLDDLGAVITGVNDAPEGAVFDADAGAMTSTLMKVPLSPGALAEQKALIAKYGDGSAATQAAAAQAPTSVQTAASGDASRVAGLDQGTAPAHPHYLDASEGTALDPLRNKTYDLNYPHTIPQFNN